MAEKTAPATGEQLQQLLDTLLPPNEEMDEESAAMLLERAGVDFSTLTGDLKMGLESGVKEMRARGEEIPPEALKLIWIL